MMFRADKESNGWEKLKGVGGQATHETSSQVEVQVYRELSLDFSLLVIESLPTHCSSFKTCLWPHQYDVGQLLGWGWVLQHLSWFCNAALPEAALRSLPSAQQQVKFLRFGSWVTFPHLVVCRSSAL